MSNANTFARPEQLEITVVCCNNLRDTSTRLHDQDPYVKLEYANSSYRTQVCKAQTRDPVFGQKFEFPIVEGHYEIEVAVWNKNTLESDYLIGSARVPIGMAVLGGCDDSMWPLQFEDRPAGQIRLIMKHQKRHIMSNMLSSLSADFGHLQPVVPYRSYETTNYAPSPLYSILEPSSTPPDPIVVPPLTNRYIPSAPSAQSLGDYNSRSYGSFSPELPKKLSSLNSSSYVLPTESSAYSRPAPESLNPPSVLNSSSVYTAASNEQPSHIPAPIEPRIRPIASLNSSSCGASSEQSLNSPPTSRPLKRPTSLESSTYVASSEPKSYSPPAPELIRRPASLNSSSYLASSEECLNSTPTRDLQERLESPKSPIYVVPSEPLRKPPPELQIQSRPLDSSSYFEAKTESSSDSPSSEFLNHHPLPLNTSSVATSEPYNNPPTLHSGSLSVLHNSPRSNAAATNKEDGDEMKEEYNSLYEQPAERGITHLRKRGRTSRSSYWNGHRISKGADSKDIKSNSETTHSLGSTVSPSRRVPNLSVCQKVMLFVVCFFFWFLVYLKVGYRFQGLALSR